MNVELRTEKLKEVRKKGFIPGVIYGSGVAATAIQVEDLDFMRTLHEFHTSKTFSIKLEGKKHIVYIKEIQNALMNQHEVIHFDLIKVSASDTLHASIPVYLEGKEKFEKSTLMVSLNRDELDIEYNVGAGISQIDVDVSELALNESIYVKDIVVPEGVKILADPEEMVVHIVETKVKEEEPESDEQHAIETSEEVTSEE